MDTAISMRAMVLCAGYGTRLGDLTRNVPKPMLLLEGHPLLEYTIAHLARNGFRQIAINLHFLADSIKDYFVTGSRWGVSIHYSEEKELLGTAGGLRKMKDFLSRDDCFLAHYGDVLTDQDLSEMLRFHRLKNAAVTMLVHQRENSNSIVEMDQEGRVTRLLERPTEVERLTASSPWVNSGVFICSPLFLDAVAPDTASDIPRDVLPKLIPLKGVYGFPLTGYRCAIDSPRRLLEAKAAIVEGRYGTVLAKDS